MSTYSLEVKVHPGSSRRELQLRDDGLHAYVTKKPERGRVNQEVTNMLSERFRIPKKNVSLLKGSKTRKKVFILCDVANPDRELSHLLRRQ